MEKSVITLRGEIERITYANEENGYAVARLRLENEDRVVTVTGIILAIKVGDQFEFAGRWTDHPKFGSQFSFQSYKPVIPATVKGIEKYLASGVIKGIGGVMAKRLVDCFGKETLQVIEDSPNRLQEVEGFGKKRIAMICDSWVEQKEVREVMVFFQGYGVTAIYAAKVFKAYGYNAIRVVKENPYRLASDISGIGFTIADKIAENLGIAKDSQVRVEAGILYQLQQGVSQGHVFCPYEYLIKEVLESLKVGREVVIKGFAALALQKKVIVEDLDDDELQENNKAIYLPPYWVAETGIAQKLKKIFSGSRSVQPESEEEAIQWTQDKLKIQLAENQIRAVRASMKNKVLVITGGPGTGKTTIIRAILRIYTDLQATVLLTAPTGRAAKRMAETTGQEAKTMHRLLEFSPKAGGFRRNESRPLKGDLIILDEASMVDSILMYHFLKAVPLAATLVLVGDVDQLPSVGAGSVLRDAIASEVLPVVRLNEIFRQSEESLIVTNAHRINRGEMPVVAEQKGRLFDFYFIEVEEPEAIVKMIVDMCAHRIPVRFGFDPISEVQVLTAMHKGTLGRLNLNEVLRTALNPSSNQCTIGGRLFKTGDKVMQIVNHYEKDVFNGDTGCIQSIDSDGQRVVVDFEGSAVLYGFKEMDNLELAYAISIHKSQGSEYPAVIIPIHTQQFILLQRNLLYTGMTRGKKLVVLVGTKKALSIAIKNNTPNKRHTMLRKRLASIFMQ